MIDCALLFLCASVSVGAFAAPASLVGPAGARAPYSVVLTLDEERLLNENDEILNDEKSI